MRSSTLLFTAREKTAAEDACRVEHYIGDKTFEAVRSYVNDHKIRSGETASSFRAQVNEG